jgi:hypothetical protein
MTKIVDTNVILVANGQHQDISADCVAVCATVLQKIMQGGRFAVDDQFEILTEYQNKPKVENQPGTAFLKWALRNYTNKSRCDLVGIPTHKTRGYESFPDDARLENFDLPDRKFVAVAAAHSEHPPILQAADSKWLGWAPALKDHDIDVEFLCREDIERFRAKKAGT